MRFDKLKRLVDPSRPITYGIVQAGPEFEGGIPYIRPADMTDESGVKDFDAVKRTSPEIAQQYSRSAVKTGDLIVSIGPSFGKVMQVPSALNGANLTQGTARVAPGPNLSARFAFWCLRSQHCYAQWDAGIGGATFRALNLGPLAETRIPNPDLATQRQIADFLDREIARIDLLIEKKQKLVALLGKKWQATLTHLTNKGLNVTPLISSSNRWIGAIPQHWKGVRLKHLLASEIAAIKPGPFGSDLRSSDMEGDYATVVNQRAVLDNDFSRREVAVTKEKYEELRSFSIRGGDILLTSRGTIGRAVIAPTDVTLSIIHPCVIRVRLNEEKILPEYFLHLLKESSFLAQVFDLSNATTIEVIYGNVLGEIAFPIPPVDEQMQINAEIKRKSERSENAIALIASSINRLKEYRSALITAAVTGQIDVATHSKSGATDRRLDAIQEEIGA